MKYNPMIWHFMIGRMKKPLKDYWPDTGELLKKAKPIYKDMLTKVEGISDKNPMCSNITTSFVIIAIWLASDRKITPDQISQIMLRALDFKPMKAVLAAMIDMNTVKGIRTFGKMMKKNAAWAEKHPEDWNTWDFHFDTALYKDGFYYHFTHCPIADFCKKYGYEEINPVLCNIDFMMISMMHARLIREHTVAHGEGICDYWVIGDKAKNPE